MSFNSQLGTPFHTPLEYGWAEVNLIERMVKLQGYQGESLMDMYILCIYKSCLYGQKQSLSAQNQGW